MFSKSLVPFEQFAPCFQFSCLFRAVCSLFSNSLLSFEWFVPVLKFPSPYRAVCALFSNSLVSFGRPAPSQMLCSLSSGLLPALKWDGGTLAGTGGETLAGTWRATLARENSGGDLVHDKKSLADDSGGDGGRRGDGGPLCGLARGQERGRPGQLGRQMARSDMTADDSDGGWRTTLAMDGEDVTAIVTHHSDVPLAFPNIATSVRLVQHGEGEEAEHKTRSSPASGGCGWVPRYEDGATHDHSLGGARRGTVTHPTLKRPRSLEVPRPRGPKPHHRRKRRQP